jgi:hypothetical protein
LPENVEYPIDYRQHAADVRKQIATSSYPRDLTKSGSTISGFSSSVSFAKKSYIRIRRLVDKCVVCYVLQRIRFDITVIMFWCLVGIPV